MTEAHLSIDDREEPHVLGRLERRRREIQDGERRRNRAEVSGRRGRDDQHREPGIVWQLIGLADESALHPLARRQRICDRDPAVELLRLEQPRKLEQRKRATARGRVQSTSNVVGDVGSYRAGDERPRVVEGEPAEPDLLEP